jgi:hypothetical protein
VTVRTIIASAAALLIAVQVARTAVVAGASEARPDVAAALWSSHPRVELSLAMTAIARAARDGRQVPASVFALVGDAASKAPLAPEPFLVRGVQAELAGDGATAQRAFEAAQWRDPRSLPAAYFLADRYFRTGDAARGLREIAALSRLAPGAGNAVGPYLAAYATDRANWPELRKLFRANPQLAEPVLVTLASDIRTVPAVLALAEPSRSTAEAQWLGPLLTTLTDSRKYAQARAIWAKAARVPGHELVYDTGFSDNRAPPPFNWALTSSAVGLAERQPGGRLHIVFYGQEDGVLATQLLVLPPGSYRLSMQLLGDAARAKSLTWSVWCDKAQAPLASITLDAAVRGWQFTVPSNCPAQWLRLSGSSSDIPEQADVTIAGLKVQKVAAGG